LFSLASTFKERRPPFGANERILYQTAALRARGSGKIFEDFLYLHFMPGSTAVFDGYNTAEQACAGPKSPLGTVKIRELQVSKESSERSDNRLAMLWKAKHRLHGA
jgi:hypothetical protein